MSGEGQEAELGMDFFPWEHWHCGNGIAGSFRLEKPSQVIEFNVSTAKATTDMSPSATSTLL